jgi:precorrin-2 dehydrogenase/sirohydrochlorin ferrochelatase
VLRRGELLIAVSTGGKSPGLAAQIKRFLGTLFGREWREHLDELARLRRAWRDSGADGATVAQWTEAWVVRQGWLPADDPLSSSALPPAIADASLVARH